MFTCDHLLRTTFIVQHQNQECIAAFQCQTDDPRKDPEERSALAERIPRVYQYLTQRTNAPDAETDRPIDVHRRIVQPGRGREYENAREILQEVRFYLDKSGVRMEGEDEVFPWAPRYKWFVSAVLVTLPLIVNVGSSVMSGTLRSLEAEFHIGPEVAVLSTTTMFLIGFVCGPLIFGPLSENYGRQWPILSGVVLFATFSIPVAVAQNFYTILVCRLLNGAFGASSMAVTGGALTDGWHSAVSRGIALDAFVTTAFGGPG
ncbi:MFS general substrate transporter [Aspergillus terreus]|uniref:MFS general substrate transporter n=1 Tax=Aspergillus terreus TaxID=33178 RepID=A0A5M3Z3M6_ASPTE|nr:hypothetical protein ATETN484_0006061300 [Aspergillus terreus]GFF20209.1 MFS general substrate transporter [Aspergillus terreus]